MSKKSYLGAEKEPNRGKKKWGHFTKQLYFCVDSDLFTKTDYFKKYGNSFKVNTHITLDFKK